MLRINAPAVLLSYMRPYVAMVTNASVYPPYNLPFCDFSDQNFDAVVDLTNDAPVDDGTEEDSQ